MLQRAGGSLAGEEDGGLEGEREGEERVAYVGGCRGGGGEDGKMMLEVVCACGGQHTAN